MNIAQSLMAGAGRSDPLMRPGGTAKLRGMLPGQASLRDDAREGRGFRFPAMNHWVTLRSPSGARHLQNALSGYVFKTHQSSEKGISPSPSPFPSPTALTGVALSKKPYVSTFFHMKEKEIIFVRSDNCAISSGP